MTQTMARGFGVVFLLIGILGLVTTPVSMTSELLLGLFPVNVLHNPVHLVFGVVLGKRGAEVRTADGSAQALDHLAQWAPDVLVSDIGTPGEDGYALIQRVRALPRDRGGRVPAVALTASVKPDDRMRARGAGFQTHVPKPVDPDELALVIARLAGLIRPPAS